MNVRLTFDLPAPQAKAAIDAVAALGGVSAPPAVAPGGSPVPAPAAAPVAAPAPAAAPVAMPVAAVPVAAPPVAAPVAAPPPAAAPVAAPVAAPAPAAVPGAVGTEDLKVAVTQLSQRSGIDAVAAVFQKWNATDVSAIPEEHRAAFLADINAS